MKTEVKKKENIKVYSINKKNNLVMKEILD